MTERPFRNLRDFIARADIGDQWTEPLRDGERTITTYVMRRRIDETKAWLDHVSTTHDGAPGYLVRFPRSYFGESAVHQVEATDYGSRTAFSRPAPGEPTGYGTLHVAGAPRFSRKQLPLEHAKTVAAYQAAVAAAVPA